MIVASMFVTKAHSCEKRVFFVVLFGSVFGWTEFHMVPKFYRGTEFHMVPKFYSYLQGVNALIN